MTTVNTKLNLTSNSVDSVTFSGGIRCVADAAAYLFAAKLSFLGVDDIGFSVDGWTANITVHFSEGQWEYCGGRLKGKVAKAAAESVSEAMATHTARLEARFSRKRRAA